MFQLYELFNNKKRKSPEQQGYNSSFWWIRMVTIITRYPLCFREYYFQIPVFILGLSVINSSSTTTICDIKPVV